MTELLIYILLAVVVGQQVFFAYNNHRLLNKIMSRSFFEYKMALNKQPTTKADLPSMPEVDVDMALLEQEIGRV